MLQSEPMVNYIRTAGAYEWYEKFYGTTFPYRALGLPGHPSHLDNWIEMLVGKVMDEGSKRCVQEFKEQIAKTETVDEAPTEERVKSFVSGYLQSVRKEFEETVRDALEHDPVAIRETSKWPMWRTKSYPSNALSYDHDHKLYDVFVEALMQDIACSSLRRRKFCVLF